MQISVTFEWTDVGSIHLTETGHLGIPNVAARPAVYGFRVAGATRPQVYIGESQNLRRLMGNYAGTHPGVTVVRIRDLLLAHLHAGQEVQLAVVDGASLKINGVPGIGKLEQQEVRLLIESAARLAARQADACVHDIARDTAVSLIVDSLVSVDPMEPMAVKVHDSRE